MYGNKEYYGFHESYYEHRCPIIPELDVLDTDIVGNSCASKIKRWWNDLFLLSSMNERAKGFYKSSHAIRIERFKQYRKYKTRIHPISKFTDFWDSLMLIVFVVDKILFRFTSTIIFDGIPIYYYYLGAFLEIIILLDLIVVMKSGYINMEMKKVILDTKKSLMYYCANKLFLHTISAIPLHWFMFLRFGNNIDCGICKSNVFICVIKIISAFGLYRIHEMFSFWIWKHNSARWRFLRIAVVGTITLLQFYDLVDVIWILTVLHKNVVDDTSYIGKLLLIKYGDFKDFSNYMIICFDISRVYKSLLLFSFGIKHSSNALDKMSSIIAYVIANCFYVWSVSECFLIISRNNYPRNKIMKARRSVLNLLITRQLSDTLRSKINQYFEFKPAMLALMEHRNCLYKSLPDVLRKEIILRCYSKLLMRMPIFNEWPLTLVDDLALLLKSAVYLSNDVVVDALVSSNGLMIIDVGVLAVYSSNHQEIGHLIDGDYFDEISLVTDKETRTSYLLAITSCRMLILDKVAFRKYMRQHLALFYELKEKLLQKYVNTTETVDPRSGNPSVRHHVHSPGHNYRSEGE